MERGVYFDGWYKHNHCYHPSLPIRTRQMLDDLECYHATSLVWAGMGGGSISLPYLEQEAFGDVEPRLRFYGAMNDKEFVEECTKRGIRLYGIVFEVQGWEFPAVFDENGRLLRLNEYAQEVPGHDWYGLREFSEDRYPDAFRTRLTDYYPDGIRNAAGERVENLWEECCCRDHFGNPVHAEWVEVKGHEQQAYQMCRNNPVWREYLKKIIALQIDAGVSGIQLDECELPMTSIGSGGCFCKDCMREFREYLQDKKKKGLLSGEWDPIDLDHFHYGEYLLERNSDYPQNAPFFREYWEFQVTQVRKYFSELVDFAKEYGMEAYGREIKVSGNFYNLQPAYHPIVPKADIIITEMEHTLFRQPYFYRYSAGFAEGKPVIIAENPYGGIIPELARLLDRGKGYDLYRLYLLEAAVYGCNMSVPYGSWMGNTIKDAFWPPRSVTCQVQDFLFEQEMCFPNTPVKGAAVIYSFASNYWRDAHRSGNANGDADASNHAQIDVMATDWGNSSMRMPFWDVIRKMSEMNALYDVKMLPDGVLREDDFDTECLAAYRLLVLPDCYILTERQAKAIYDYAERGGSVLVYGRLAENTKLKEKLLQLKQQGMNGICFTEPDEEESLPAFSEAFSSLYARISVLNCHDSRIGVHRYDSDDSVYIHVLNYAFDREQDAVQAIDKVEITLTALPGRRVRVFRLDGETNDFEVYCDKDEMRLNLYHVPVYSLIVIRT